MGEHTSRLSGFTFRACSRDDTDLVRAASSTRRNPGRFNTPEVGAVYVSREPTTAIEELRRTARRDGASLADAHPCSMLVVDLRLHEVLDLTVPSQRRAWSLTAEDLTSEDMGRCQEVAPAALDRGIEVIRWPSATGAGQSLAVFLDRLRSGSCVELRDRYDLTRPMLRAIADGSPVESVLAPLRAVPLLDAAGTCGASPHGLEPARACHVPPDQRSAGRHRRE